MLVISITIHNLLCESFRRCGEFVKSPLKVVNLLDLFVFLLPSRTQFNVFQPVFLFNPEGG
jgi:hypothetical protein